MTARIATLLLALALALPAAGCGKKASLDAPPDSTYPRTYPSAR